ncbi:MAG: hypothetical protein AAF212_04045 [Verrucomicrobiota bacterium]
MIRQRAINAAITVLVIARFFWILLPAQEPESVGLSDLMNQSLVPQTPESSPIEGFGNQNVLEFEIKAAVDRLILMAGSYAALDPDLVYARSVLKNLLEQYQTEFYRKSDDALLISAFHALGDSWVIVKGLADYPSAWGSYAECLSWLAGKPRSDWAAKAYVEIFTRTFEDSQFLAKASDREQIAAMSQPWVTYLRDILQLVEDNATGLYILALFDQFDQATSVTEKLRIRETYELALIDAEEMPWYDSARFHYGLWLQEIGNASIDGEGQFITNPDLPTAALVFRSLTDSLSLTRAQQQEISERLSELERPEIVIEISQVYLPGADVDLDLVWKNKTEGFLRIFEIEPEIGFSFEGLESNAQITDAVIVSPEAEILEIPVNRDDLENPYIYETKTIQLPLALELGAYLVEFETDGSETAQEILWVTDIAQINSVSNSHQTITLINAEFGTSVDEGYFIRRWIWNESSGAWRQQNAELESDSASVRLEHGSSDSRFWVLSFSDESIAFSYSEVEANNSVSEIFFWAFADKNFVEYGDVFEIAYEAVMDLSDSTGEEFVFRVTDAEGTQLLSEALTLDADPRGVIECSVPRNAVPGLINWEVFSTRREETVFKMPITQLAPRELSRLEIELTLNNSSAVSDRGWSFTPGSTVDISGVLLDPVADQTRSGLCRLKAYRAPLSTEESGESGIKDIGPTVLMLGMHTFSDTWSEAFSEEATADELGRFTSLVPVIESLGSRNDRYQYWVDVSYFDSVTGKWISGGWVAFVVSQHSYVGRMSLSSKIVEPGDSVLFGFESKSPFNEPVGVDGQITLSRKEWEETWIDSRGRQLSGSEYRETRSRRGFFRSWSESDRAFRLLESGFQKYPIFSRKVTLAPEQRFQQQIQLNEPGIYELIWMDVDSSGQPIQILETIYCVDPNSGSTQNWNLQEIVWLSPDLHPRHDEEARGMVLFPDVVKRAWIELEGDGGRKMAVFPVDRGMVALSQSDFPNVWDGADEIRIGTLEGARFRTTRRSFMSAMAAEDLEVRISQSKVGPEQPFEVSLSSASLKDDSQIWYILSPEGNESMKEGLNWIFHYMNPDNRAFSWNTSFDSLAYYFPENDSAAVLETIVSRRDITGEFPSNDTLFPLAVNSIPNEIMLLDYNVSGIRRVSISPPISSFYEAQALAFDDGKLWSYGSDSLEVVSPISTSLRVPPWARSGDEVVVVSSVSNNENRQQVGVFETRFSKTNRKDTSSLNRMSLRPFEQIEFRSYFEVPPAPKGMDSFEGAIKLRKQDTRWSSETFVDIFPDESSAARLMSMERLQEGLWKNEEIEFSELDAIYISFSTVEIIEIVKNRLNPVESNFLVPHLRDILFELYSEPFDLSKIDGNLSVISEITSESRGTVFFENAQDNLFWSAFAYILLLNVESRSGETFAATDKLDTYLSQIVLDSSLQASARIWALFALSTRHAVTETPATQIELTAYQRMWRIRGTLPPYALKVLGAISERYGLIEDREFWIQLANQRLSDEPLQRRSSRLVLGLSNASAAFFTLQERKIIEDSLSGNIHSSNPIEISTDGLGRDFLLQLLLELELQPERLGIMGAGLNFAKAFDSVVQVRVADRILSSEEFEVVNMPSGALRLTFDPSVALNSPKGSLTFSVQGEVQPKEIYAELKAIASDAEDLSVDREVNRVRRVQTLLRGVVEELESVEEYPVILQMDDRLNVELKIRNQRDSFSVVFREPLPAGMRLNSRDLKLISRSGIVLSDEFIDIEVDPYGFTVYAQALPAGEWSLAYRLSPEYEGDYQSGVYRLYRDLPEYQRVSVSGYSVTITDELD